MSNQIKHVNSTYTCTDRLHCFTLSSYLSLRIMYETKYDLCHWSLPRKKKSFKYKPEEPSENSSLSEEQRLALALPAEQRWTGPCLKMLTRSPLQPRMDRPTGATVSDGLACIQYLGARARDKGMLILAYWGRQWERGRDTRREREKRACTRIFSSANSSCVHKQGIMYVLGPVRHSYSNTYASM